MRRSETALIALFLLGISLPGALHLISAITDREAAQLENENRLAAPLPRFEETGLRGFTSGMEAWMGDHFGLRGSLIDLYTNLQDELGLATNDEVIKGQGQWLFLNHGDMTQDLRGLVNPQSEKLDSWVHGITQLNQYAESRNAHFLTLVAPNKQSVYSEFLPAHIRPTDGARRIDWLKAELNRKGVIALYPLEGLVSAKNDYPTYFRTDTHWTGWGAYQAYLNSMTQLQAISLDLPILPTDRLRFGNQPNKPGDLVGLLGSDEYTEDRLTISVADSSKTETETVEDHTNPSLRTKIITRDREGPALLILGDSFSPFMVPFFTESFGRVILVRHEGGNIDLATLDQFDADVILFEVVERMLVNRMELTNRANPDAPQTD